jgi:protein gp37
MLPVRWDKRAQSEGVRLKVFSGSMCDIFDPEAPDEWRYRLFKLIEATPHLDWQLLTKRANQIRPALEKIGFWKKLPMPNVWLGFSAGAQRYFDLRWPIIRSIPALVRFVSYEPALGPLHLPEDVRGKLHWLIAGGETSMRRNGGRPMDPAWARSICQQCAALGVAFWFKQTGNWFMEENGEFRWHGKGSQFYRDHYELLDGEKKQQFPEVTI